MLSPGRLREAGLMEDVRSLRFSASAAPLHCQPVVTKLVEWRCQPVAQLYIDGLHFRQQELADRDKRAPQLAFIQRVDERARDPLALSAFFQRVPPHSIASP